ncbi:MAG: chemotaxis-specific protein-glutamate methyltransferase CheB [Deltaproteobacteria bacterium]|nr:chemotaxis-specific protein-glutamate methyltransferase CheB [Deltaproteobacteria bacterium]
MNRNIPASMEGAPVVDGDSPRVLVVDDSAPLRGALAEVLEEGGCEVVGRAMDGSMALSLVHEKDPDVITLDLEMPRMDGFTFLRILGKTRATPVIVVTSDARPESALLALELGARDFVVKPVRTADVRTLKAQLLARVRLLAGLRRRIPPTWSPPPEVAFPPDTSMVAIGCSTGGPRALRDILTRLRGPLRAPVLIAQHMPPRFTEAFADRLAKATSLDVAEAKDGEPVVRGVVRIAPGGRHLSVERGAAGARLRLHDPAEGDRWVPSVDRLFSSAAAVAGSHLLAVVLTGMGRDGVEGARAVRAVGAPLWTESSLTAAIDGMPVAAAAAHGAADRVPLDELAAVLARGLEDQGGQG